MEKRSRTINFTTTQEIREHVEKMSKEKDISMSDYINQLIRKDMQEKEVNK